MSNWIVARSKAKETPATPKSKGSLDWSGESRPDIDFGRP